MKIRGPKPLVWRGYRNCDRCTRWRPVSDFTVYQTRTGYEQIKGTCEECKKRVERERYARLTPEQKRAKGIKANKQAKKRREKALREIERQARILDKQNEKLEKQWDKIERAQKYTRAPRHVYDDDSVDITPFRMWLLRQYREHGYVLDTLAKEIGMDPSRTRRFLDGYMWNGAGRNPDPIRHIRLSTVDKIGAAIGDPELLERLYPLEVEDD